MLYSKLWNCGRIPAIDAMLIMDPHPRSHIPGATKRVSRNALLRFTSTILSNWASVISSAGPCAMLVPALFTRMSMRPNSRVARSTMRSRSSSRPTWQAIGAMRPASSRATWSSASCLRPQITTAAPSRANTSAMDRPMPRLAPVTIATLFSNRLTVSAASDTRGTVRPDRAGAARTRRWP